MTRIPHAAALFAAVALVLGAAPTRADSLQDARDYLRQGQYDRALQAADGYLAGRPKSPDGRLAKGAALAQLGRSAEAVQVYAALIRDYPALPEPRNNLAVLYASLGQYDKARAELEAALRTHPSYAAAYDNLGEIYTRMAGLSYERALGNGKAPQAAPSSRLALMTGLPRSGERNEPLRVATALPATAQPLTVPPAATVAAAAPAAVPAPAVPAPAAPVAAKPAPAAPAVPAPAAKPIVVAAKPAPAPEKPAGKPAEKPAPKPRADESEAVLQAVNGWAEAWSSQNVGAYLGYYAREFTPPKGETRASWEKIRRARISAPKSIKVTITAPRVKVEKDGSRASVTFRQRYEGGALVNTTMKTLEMVKVGKRWQIAEERIGR